MTKDAIIELQNHVYCARKMFWQLLLGGKFASDDYAKAIFTCYFTLDKVADLTDKYLLQLPLEACKPDVYIDLQPSLIPLPEEQTTPLVNSDAPGAKLHRRRTNK
jgi:hypothetical protein